jgi:hypothetical protein
VIVPQAATRLGDRVRRADRGRDPGHGGLLLGARGGTISPMVLCEDATVAVFEPALQPSWMPQLRRPSRASAARNLREEDSISDAEAGLAALANRQ